MLRNEVWATIAPPKLETVPCDPDPFAWFGHPDLFPIFRKVETFLCFACIERRLGRQLTQEDLNISPWNAGWINYEDWNERNEGMQWWARDRRLLPHCSATGGA
jgi:hypothetical protein